MCVCVCVCVCECVCVCMCQEKWVIFVCFFLIPLLQSHQKQRLEQEDIVSRSLTIETNCLLFCCCCCCCCCVSGTC